MKSKSYCIICGEEKDGIAVRDDSVLRALRWFNRTVLRTPPRNNRIVVCASCYPKYKKQRSKYLSRQKTYIVLGVLFMIFGIVIARTITAFFLSLVVLAFLYLLSLLSYVPELDVSAQNNEERSQDGTIKAGGGNIHIRRRASQ